MNRNENKIKLYLLSALLGGFIIGFGPTFGGGGALKIIQNIQNLDF